MQEMYQNFVEEDVDWEVEDEQVQPINLVGALIS